MVDRNRVAKEQVQAQFAQAQMRKRFMADLASGATGAYDKDRKRLEAGHLVYWEPPPFLYWLVEDVGPALEQAGPAMRIKLTITVPLIVRPGEPVMNMVVQGRQGKPPAADGEKAKEEPTDGASKEHADGRDTSHPKPGD